MMMQSALLQVNYDGDAEKLVSKIFKYMEVPAVLFFMMSIMGFSHQSTAKRGNMIGALGMLLAIFSVAGDSDKVSEDAYIASAVSIVPGVAIGIVVAMMVGMTQMPQMVGLLNSFGGLSAAMASIGFFLEEDSHYAKLATGDGRYANFTDAYEFYFARFAVLFGVVIGVPTFTGSIIACAKLQGTINGRALVFPFRHGVSALLFIATATLGVLFCISDNNDTGLLYLMIIVAIVAIWGVLFVMAIGGADMPVVISALNSGSGWSASAAGFTVASNVLIASGAVVGASGAILSYIMCRAMNRPFFGVMAGGFGEVAESNSDADKFELKFTETQSLVNWIKNAKRVVFAPGYGMAVAQAQHTIAQITSFLQAHGIDVKFAIHPVAGRLPGHMNVLLSEARVPYDVQLALEDINPELESTDVAIVIGANDVVNPGAVEEPVIPQIAGMPVLEVWKAKHVVVLKRTAGGRGYSGVVNRLFGKDNCHLLLGDAKKTVDELLTGLHSEMGDAKKQAAHGASVEMKNMEDEREKELEEVRALPTFMPIGIPCERSPKERRVAVTPTTAIRLRKQGFQVYVEAKAGLAAGFSDADYAATGCHVVDTAEELWNAVKLVLKVDEITEEEAELASENTTIISMFDPKDERHQGTLEIMSKKQLTQLGMQFVPRITRAQKFDVLSSMANVAGYRAVIEATANFGRFFMPQITAAGQLPPAKVLVIGAGVAGLAAIGAARSLGAIVRAFDVRPVVKTEVESMGADFLMLHFAEDGSGTGGYAKIMSPEFIAAEMELFAQQAKEVDIIITTAQIPGRKAPRLIEGYMVESMKRGSVIVDLAAASGGNVEGTVADERIVTSNGVVIIGYTDFASRMADTSSYLYSSNLCHLLDDMGQAENYEVDEKNEVIRQLLIMHEGERLERPPRIQPAPVVDNKEDVAVVAKETSSGLSPTVSAILMYSSWLVAFGLMAVCAPVEFVPNFIVFVIACVLGYKLVWGVVSSLHTPLMSITNAISGIVILSGLEQINDSNLHPSGSRISVAAAFIAAINVGGGFWVTHRMLNMFFSSSELAAEEESNEVESPEMEDHA
jgi:NAD(P) transhydrogenase